MWLESMPPSSAWNQLHSWTRLETSVLASGRSVHSRWGRGGGLPAPMYAKMTPPRSSHGYATWRTFDAKLDSGGSLGISRQRPSEPNFQPW